MGPTVAGPVQDPLAVSLLGNRLNITLAFAAFKNHDILFGRVVQDEWMALDVDGKVRDSACFASGWYDNILEKVECFYSSK